MKKHIQNIWNVATAGLLLSRKTYLTIVYRLLGFFFRTKIGCLLCIFFIAFGFFNPHRTEYTYMVVVLVGFLDALAWNVFWGFKAPLVNKYFALDFSKEFLDKHLGKHRGLQAILLLPIIGLCLLTIELYSKSQRENTDLKLQNLVFQNALAEAKAKAGSQEQYLELYREIMEKYAVKKNKFDGCIRDLVNPDTWQTCFAKLQGFLDSFNEYYICDALSSETWNSFVLNLHTLLAENSYFLGMSGVAFALLGASFFLAIFVIAFVSKKKQKK